MTYQEFKNKYNGKYVDYDGAYGAQCWDLGQKYFTECLGLSPDILGGCGLVSNMLKEPKLSLIKKYFDEVSANNMQPGDVVIWYYGHIAIFDHWSESEQARYYFSQNPNPSQVMKIDAWDFKTFRLKKKETPKITLPTPVQKNEKVDQIEVLYDNTVRVRKAHNLSDDNIIGLAKKGFYNIISTYKVDGFDWYELEKDKWIATVKDVSIFRPKVEEKPVEIPREEQPIENTEKEPVSDTKEEDSPISHPTSETSDIGQVIDKKTVIDFIIKVLNKIIEYLKRK